MTRGVGRAIGVDVGSRFMAMAVVDRGEGGFRPVALKTWQFTGTWPERRARIRESAFSMVYGFAAYAPDIVFIEEPLSKSMRVAKILGVCKTIVEEQIIAQHGPSLETYSVHAATWRAMVSRLAGVPTSAAKEGAMKLAVDLAGPLGVSCQDEADALMVALAGFEEVMGDGRGKGQVATRLY